MVCVLVYHLTKFQDCNYLACTWALTGRHLVCLIG